MKGARRLFVFHVFLFHPVRIDGARQSKYTARPGGTRTDSREQRLTKIMADVTAPTIRTFQVFPDIPTGLAPLLELAQNLWWSWHPDAVELFRRLDRDLWETVYHNPVKMLGAIAQDVLAAAAKDDGYQAHLTRVYDAFKRHLSEEGWFHKNHPDLKKFLVAYFSAEF